MIADGGNYSKGDGSNIGVVELWNASTGRLITTMATSATDVYTIAFSSDSKSLAVGGVKNFFTTGVLELFNVSSGALTKSFPTAATAVNSVAFSPDGATLADGGNLTNQSTQLSTGVLELWGLSKDSLLATLNSGLHHINSVAFSPNGKTLAAGGISD